MRCSNSEDTSGNEALLTPTQQERIKPEASPRCAKGSTWVTPETTAFGAMPSIDKNATQQKKSEASKPLTLLARPVYPGTRGTPHTDS